MKKKFLIALFLIAIITFVGSIYFNKDHINAVAQSTGAIQKSDQKLGFNGSTVGYGLVNDTYTDFMYYKYANTDGVTTSYICASGMRVVVNEGNSCQLSTLSNNVDLSVAYIINSLSGQNGGVVNMSNKLTEYYWIEMVVFYHLGKDDGKNHFSSAMYSNVVDGPYILPNGKTFMQTINEANSYRERYSKPMNLTLSQNSLSFTQRTESGEARTPNIYIYDNNNNIDSYTISLDNSAFGYKEGTDSSGKYFYVYAKKGQVGSSGASVTATVKSNNTYYKAKYYDCGEDYQTMISTKTEEEHGDQKQVSITGSANYPSMTIKKVDENGNNIAGATIRLTCISGECRSKMDYKDFTTTTSPIVIANGELLYGEYDIAELKAPDGYVRDTQKQYKTVSSSQPNIEVSFTNKLTEVEISKKDAATNEELPGATLEILGSNKKPISCKIKEPSGNIKSLNTCTWVSTSTPTKVVGLKEGTYYLTETQAPSGYTLNKEQKAFIVSSTGVSSKVTMQNSYTSISIVKYSVPPDQNKLSEEPGMTFADYEQGELYSILEGATLRILDSSKKDISCTVEVENGKTETLNPCKWVTEDKSKVIYGLENGTYYLEELEAPEGYKKRTDLIKFSITDETKNVNLRMFNEYEKIEISKQNSVDNKELPGATLSILDENKEKMPCKIMYEKGNLEELEECTWVSKDKPVTVYGLSKGKYYLKEEMAPEGYEQYEELIEFNFPDDKEVVMTNVLSVPVPDTLSSRSTLLISIAMIDIAIGIGVLVYVKKNKFQD